MGPAIKWSIEKIKSGFLQFFQEYGRYPTALEIDAYPSLPTSRQIQRKFGGLLRLRKMLNLPGLKIIDYTTGEYRSQKALTLFLENRKAEIELNNFLVQKFGEIFVHEQKPFNNYQSRVDFLIYSKNYTFGIDIFWANDEFSLKGVCNNKRGIYRQFPYDIFFVCTNSTIQQSLINKIIANKKVAFASHIRVLNIDEFKKLVNALISLQVT